MTYNLSKDYEKLYELICDGFEAVCYYEWAEGEKVLCRCYKNDHGLFFQGENISYPELRKYRDYYEDQEGSEFIAECKRMSLEYIQP